MSERIFSISKKFLQEAEEFGGSDVNEWGEYHKK